MTMSLFDLSGSTALVTGASRGIGQVLAVGLAEAGADVVLVSTHLSGTLETRTQIEALGRRAWSLGADLAHPEAVEGLFREVSSLGLHVNILVNNAGIIRRNPAETYALSDWDAVLSVNLSRVFALCQTFGKPMLDRGAGKIINVASLLSFQGGITVPAYTAAKHGVAGLTKALANEWAGRGVQVNALAPGYIRTDNTAALQANPEREASIRARIPAGRWGEPADLVGAALFLASRASSYVHGHTLVVDGGWMAR